MRDRYWNIELGAAGENIVITADDVVALDDLGERIIVRGEGREVVLEPVKVAKPCLQFTSYMLALPGLGSHDELKADLAFLDDGTRGFIVTIGEDVTPTRIRVGDEVFIA